MKNLRKKMYGNIQAYNKYLTNKYLDQFELEQLLSFIHPEERDHFKRKIFLND